MVTADDIDALLPQTQCTRCGYSGCRPYAEALLAAKAPINQCPPGGAAGIGAPAAMVPRASLADTPPAPTAHDNRERFLAHNARSAVRARARDALLTARKQAARPVTGV